MTQCPQGRIVSTIDDIHRLLTEFPSDKPLAVTVIRGERRYGIEVRDNPKT